MADTMRARMPVVGWLGGKIVEGDRRELPAPGMNAAPVVLPNIIFAKRGDAAKLSSRTLDLIRAQAAAQGIAQLTISSTQRDARRQAGAMYDNLARTGEQAQRRLYDPNGEAVIDVALAERRAGSSRDAAILAMMRRIEEIRTADSNAFKHLVDPTRLQAVDIDPRSLRGYGSEAERRDRLLSGFRREKGISRVLGPPRGDPAIHIEIPQD